MRYRLLHLQERKSDGYHAASGMWKPSGGVQIAESAQEALEDFHPVAGRWLVLCEDAHTWRMFRVEKRTETDIEPLDMDAGDISSAMLGHPERAGAH